ncbi:MAG: hypothetical protein JWM99_4443 [Verrucomicrobiales bacterium]|nr:hypothetical protein [Verrucomicrobiales bacterium]
MPHGRFLERIEAGKDEGFVSAHTLAECYRVLTRLPGESHVPPATAWQLISENVVKHFKIIHLTAKEYAQALEKASANGVEGGRTYDALLLAAAAKSGADRIITSNVRHFQALAEDNLRSRISAP